MGGGSGAVHFGFRFGVALVGGAVRFAVAALAAIGRAQVIRRRMDARRVDLTSCFTMESISYLIHLLTNLNELIHLVNEKVNQRFGTFMMQSMEFRNGCVNSSIDELK